MVNPIFLPSVRVSKHLGRLVNEVFGKSWVTPQASDGFYRVTMSNVEKLVGAVFERKTLSGPRSETFWDFVENRVHFTTILERGSKTFFELTVALVRKRNP